MNDSRIKKLIFSLAGIDGILIDNPSDLLYLTGLTLSKGRLWADAGGAKLFVDGRYFGKAKREAPCEVVPFDEKHLIETLQGAGRIGYDSAFLTCEQFQIVKRSAPEADWVPVPRPLKELRMVKDSGEIAALKKAAKLTWEGYQSILPKLQLGVSEIEIAAEFEYFCRKNGAGGFSFDSIVAFGENSAFPHYRAGKAALQDGQIVLADVGAIADGYRGDMTRVFFFGKPNPTLKFFHELVVRAQNKAVQAVRPGVRLGELDEIVREEFRKEGVEKLYTHSLGHGIGLETHEYPLIRFDNEDKGLILKSGMVFTIEPGLYQEGLGGVRYEDMIWVTEKGCENFFAP